MSEPNKQNNNLLKAYVDLCRPFTMLAPSVGVYAGSMMAAEGSFPQWGCIVAAFVGGLLNAASNVLNQVTDLEIDRINKPERPLPSGKITIPAATATAILLYLLCLGIAFFAIGPWFFLVILAGAACSWAYSIPPVRTKNNPFLANPTMAFPRGVLLIVAGYVAQLEITGNLDIFREKPAPWAAGAIMFFFLLGAATTKDFADISGDKALGARTFPVILGVRKAAWLIAPSFVLPYFLLPVAVYSLGYLIPPVMPLMLLALYGVYIAWLILRDPDSLALEGNHPSWKHMYLLMIFTQVGFAAAYYFGL